MFFLYQTILCHVPENRNLNVNNAGLPIWNCELEQVTGNDLFPCVQMDSTNNIQKLMRLYLLQWPSPGIHKRTNLAWIAILITTNNIHLNWNSCQKVSSTQFTAFHYWPITASQKSGDTSFWFPLLQRIISTCFHVYLTWKQLISGCVSFNITLKLHFIP